jgi:hypothetical protein
MDDQLAALREHYGKLGAHLEPGELYQVVKAAGRMFAVRWPDAQPRRLPASFYGHSLHFRQWRYGWQLPGWAPHLDGVCDSLDELADELRRLRAADNEGAALASVEPELVPRRGRSIAPRDL